MVLGRVAEGLCPLVPETIRPFRDEMVQGREEVRERDSPAPRDSDKLSHGNDLGAKQTPIKACSKGYRATTGNSEHTVNDVVSTRRRRGSTRRRTHLDQRTEVLSLGVSGLS